MAFRNFVANLNQYIGVQLPSKWEAMTDEVVLAQRVLERLNEYFYQTYDGIGTTTYNDKEHQYFSEFHKFWEANHAEILNARVDRTQARIVAFALHDALLKFGMDIFQVRLRTYGLSKQAIAQVRFFTANQDFRQPPEDQFGKYLVDYTEFEAEAIAENPVGLLSFLGMSRLSQSDKRVDYAKRSAEFLLERNIKAYDIASYYDNDAATIRKEFLAYIGMGYGNKKTDMFIRDMAVLDVWPNLANLQVVDVASDRNTMKLALRTRVLQTDIPLLSSFLDIFGYQYVHIDAMSAAAWRAVWEEWKAIAPDTAPVAPCMMDYLLYRIGREYCDDKLTEFVCINGHRFFHFGGRLKLCPTCRSPLEQIRRRLPCQIQQSQMPRDEAGNLRLEESNLLRTFDGACIFESACRPKSDEFRKLSPPKSIS